MPSRARRILWVAGGLVSLGLAAAGVVLPLLPTTPFLLLAAFFFARSSPRLHDWLLTHRQFGHVIEAWRRERAIPRRAKRLAYTAMSGVFALSLVMAAPAAILAIQALVLSGSAAFIATRPTARE